MPNNQPALRFDHREIAVIFSLFIFVSLLMFTVGILVGKGLTQAKYEGWQQTGTSVSHHGSTEESLLSETKGTLVTTNAEPIARTSEPAAERIPANSPASPGVSRSTENAPHSEPLKLIPQKEKAPDPFAGSLLEPKKSAETEKILSNPKLKGLIEGGISKRKIASVKHPPSAPSLKGRFMVQVGSYPSEKDATERIEALKKMDFPNAFFTPSEIGDKKETWYRVWLGHFPDFQTAKMNGEMLQERGEVKNFLVRKAETTD